MNAIWTDYGSSIKEALELADSYRFAGETPLKEHSIAVLDAMRERGEIPPGIREQFVQDLLASHLCICGRPIEEESEEHRRLLDVLERAQFPHNSRTSFSRLPETSGQLTAAEPHGIVVKKHSERLMAQLMQTKSHR